MPFLMATLPWACSERGATSPSTPQTGAEVFAVACARCHGPDGRGGGAAAVFGAAAPDLTRPGLKVTYADRSALIELLKEGRGQMPPHRGRLSPEDLEKVGAFVAEHVLK